MSTTAAPSQLAASQARPANRVGFGHLMLAEWTKIRTVRSTVWSLAIFVVGTLLLTWLFCWLAVHAIQTGRAPRRSADFLADPVAFVLRADVGLGQLAICVLGALTITTEYSTGVIRASLLAVPKRLPVLAAKGVVFAGLIFVIAEVVSFVCFFIGQAVVHPVLDVSLSQPDVTRAVIGAGLYLTVLGLFALAIGSLIRHSAGAIAAVIGLVLVVGGLLNLLDNYDWGRHVHDWFPSVAGSYITTVHQASDQVLSPWQGFAVFCVWTALLLAGGAYLLNRRDA